MFWFFSVAGILTYAVLDLQANPWLHQESYFTVNPSLERLPDILHWGGRLLRHGAWPLLLANAIVLGGLIAVLVAALLGWWERRRKTEPEPERVLVVPLGIEPSAGSLSESPGQPDRPGTVQPICSTNRLEPPA